MTVPHFLELLLLSGHPQHREFCSNMKYVVLDEVHCIADQEEGPKWERIIQLLPCPFLAMSATVRTPTTYTRENKREERQIKERGDDESLGFKHLLVHCQMRSRI